MNWSDYFSFSGVEGTLYWYQPTSSRVNEGDIISSTHSSGYLQVQVNGKKYFAHRIIWEMANGPIPEGMQIDHINHKPNDNRLVNLRLVTVQANACNKSLLSNNSSGAHGVGWHKKSSKWMARIKVNGVTRYLGTFESKEDAITARKAAELSLGFHSNHGFN